MAIFNGTAESDTINGGAENDVINGFCSDDSLSGGDGADVVNGGAGDDSLSTNDDAGAVDNLFGGAGDDWVSINRFSFLPGSVLSFEDNADGGSRDEYAGDTLFLFAFSYGVTPTNLFMDLRGAANGGAAFLPGGGRISGFETFLIELAEGNDTLLAPTSLSGQFSYFSAGGGGGDDILVGGSSTDSLAGGQGMDYLDGGAGDDGLFASNFPSAASDGFADTLIGGAGNDVFRGASEDYYSGGTGNDSAIVSFEHLSPGLFVDFRTLDPNVAFGLLGGGSIIGAERIGVALTDGADTFLDGERDGFASLGDGADIAVMGGGADVVDAAYGADYVDGGAGDDLIVDTGGRNLAVSFDIALGFGPDVLHLGEDFSFRTYAQYSVIFGGPDTDDDTASDTFLGGAGDDTIYFGMGDFVNGGTNTAVGDYGLANLAGATSDLYYDFASFDPSTVPFFPLAGGGGMTGIESIFLIAGSGNDVVIDTNRDGGSSGGLGNDVLVGLGGNDFLIGDDGASFGFNEQINPVGGGNDYLDGGDGDDVLVGEGGQDTMLGGAGDDLLAGFDDAGTEADVMVGGAGNDIVDGDHLDYMDGGAGTDVGIVDFDSYGSAIYFDMAAAFGGGVLGFAGGGSMRGFERGGVYATQYNDTLFDANWDGYVNGQFGNDYIAGRDGNDDLIGGAGNDWIEGGVGNDWIFGGEGADTMFGGAGDDMIGAVDEVLERGLLATLPDAYAFIPFGDFEPYYEDYTDASNDVALGGIGNDTIFGWGGDDYLAGEDGNDNLYGGNGVDQLLGGVGNDFIVGGCGIDYMTGGAGADTFQFDADGNDYDFITDFSGAGGDRLALDGSSVLGFLTGDYDGDGQADDTLLGYAGGNIVVLNVTGFTVDQWNSWVIV